MTTNSTKYFCNRGALSARFILVDTPLRGEYYYDGEHGKYYFGARYFDPFFGMWMSPDPAAVFFREVYAPLKWRDFIEKDILQRLNGEAVLLKHSFRASAQFSNPYSYGGDPINYIDPTGMWAIGLGLVVGWNKENGWSLGVGAAADFEVVGANFSYSFNQDGSKSLNFGVNANFAVQTFVYLEINMGLGLSMNSYSGTTLSTHGGVCIGEGGACVGVGTGGSLYWDRGGSFMGATVYAEVYASLGMGMARVSAGYEAGLFGMEGRGLYAGASAGGLYAQYAQNGGWNYGFQESVYVGVGDDFGSTSANGKQKNVGFEMWIPSLGSFGRFSLGDTYDVSKLGLKNAQTEALLKYAKETKNEALAAFIQKNGIELNNKMFNELQRIVNIKTLSFPYDLSGTYDKAVVLTKSNDYPHIEFKYNQITFPEGKSSTFSSYNYGNNIFSHLAIDFIGYHMSRSVYNVSD